MLMKLKYGSPEIASFSGITIIASPLQVTPLQEKVKTLTVIESFPICID
jgi:hypothetical protein